MEIIFTNWIERFKEELQNVKSLKIISPFIGENMCDMIVQGFNIDSVELITRFNIRDWAMGVSSINGIEMLFNKGVKIYGVKDLHSKVYIFDDSKAIVSSANFTNGGLVKNHECGILIDDKEKVAELCKYFESLKVELPLNEDLLEKFIYETHIAEMQLKVIPKFHDYGLDLNQVNNIKMDIKNFSNIFFVNIGDVIPQKSVKRTWQSNRDYCFISGGQEVSFSNQLKNISKGDLILAYSSQRKKVGGYIGVGVLEEKAIRIDNFFLDDGKDLRNRDLIDKSLFDNHDNNNSEFCIRIKWIKTIDKNEGIWRKGLFVYRNTACNMKDQQETIKYVLDKMELIQ